MINEANESSSACRLWRIHQVETSTRPQANTVIFPSFQDAVKGAYFTLGYQSLAAYPGDKYSLRLFPRVLALACPKACSAAGSALGF